MTFFEGRPVYWEDHPTLLLPAEKRLSHKEQKRRALEAFKQRQMAADPDIHERNVASSITELEKIKKVLD